MTQSTIPPDAKQVFQGVIFDVWQWKQKMFDGTIATFEKIKRPDTVEVLATVGDKILIEEQEQPDRSGVFLTLPAGRADKSDDLLKEAKRELLEETGYTSSDWTLWKTFIPSHKIIHAVHYFIARRCAHVQEPTLDPGERITTKLIPFDTLLLLSDDPRFWTAQEFVNFLLRCRFDQNIRESFRQALFPSHPIDP